jgi:ubiquinone biosynthesis UbiH/UbiF/VisC/COQ6 family hydroxylase
VSTAPDFDVVIAGGGMVGASLACALAQFCRVAVVESFPLNASAAAAPVYRPSFDARSTALSLSSVAFLQGIGLWSTVIRHAEPIRHIHVSDQGRFGSTRMDAADEGLEALGYIVENHWLGAVLHGALRERPNLRLIAPASVEAVTAVDGGAQLLLRAGEETRSLHAGLAVIADGARSALAARLGIDSEERNYGQTAVIANIAHAAPHGGRAFERFCDSGPLAMLPLTRAEDGRSRSALVWVKEAADAAEILALDERAFLRRLQPAFGYRLGRLLAAGNRASYSLALVQATEQVRAGIVVLGNAAHTLHPVAGQGFNLSLRDVAALVGALRTAHTSGERRIIPALSVSVTGCRGFSAAACSLLQPPAVWVW